MLLAHSTQISSGFKKRAFETVLAIVLFIFVYLLLVVVALGLTLLCAYLAYLVISLGFNFLTIIVGLGILSVGILQLIFLIKFIFKKHVTDLSSFVEIKEADEPKLFAFIKEIVEEVGTDFPKKIYLSADVNAFVFYDSSFWSMFLPIRKNLNIGIGLVNTIHKDELKAILAHEFGHFSQKSMKVGSYVYNVNQVLYNLLYDNDGYNQILGTWSNVHGFMGFFVNVAAEIAGIIQKILKWVYDFINIKYNSLSREMEFHADEVAAHVTGYLPLANSLLRMDLSSSSYQEVMNFYQNKIQENISTENVFPQQLVAMKHLAKSHKLTFEHHLPVVTIEHLNFYNKSKLNLYGQWATHPSVEDRVEALKNTGIEKPYDPSIPASVLFQNFDTLGKTLTKKVFEQVNYAQTPQHLSLEDFEFSYSQNYESNNFPEVFNHYFDYRAPIRWNEKDTCHLTQAELFSPDKVDVALQLSYLESDIEQIKNLSSADGNIKNFDYAGTRYPVEDAPILAVSLQKELEILKEKALNHEQLIASYMHQLAVTKGKENTLNELFNQIELIEKSSEENWKRYLELAESTSFISETNTFDIIEKRMENLKAHESIFKQNIQHLLQTEPFASLLLDKHKSELQNFLDKDRVYFERPHYNNATLQVLWDTMGTYQSVWLHLKFQGKKQVLQFYAELF